MIFGPPAIAALNLSHHFVVDLADEASKEIHGKSDLVAHGSWYNVGPKTSYK